MTPAEAIQELMMLEGLGDIEIAHSKADEILCDLLIALGHDDVVWAWKQVPKWYA